MKQFRLSLGYFVALAAALLLQATANAEVKHNSAIVRAVRGAAQISNDGGKNWSNAKVGARLKANSMIKTGADGQTDLFLGENGPVVRVRENAQLGIDKLDSEDTGIEKVIETQLDLKSGQILGNVKKMAAASKYEVKTPMGVAGIRGTQYAISADGTVTVVEGVVVVVYVINGQIVPAITVNAGQTVTPPVGGGNATLTAISAQTLSFLNQQFGEILLIGLSTPQPPRPNTGTTGPDLNTALPPPPNPNTIIDISESARNNNQN
jgi:hypothetical protein